MGHAFHHVTHAISHVAHNVIHTATHPVEAIKSAVTNPIHTIQNVIAHPYQALNNPTATLVSALPNEVQDIAKPLAKPLEHVETMVNTHISRPISQAMKNMVSPKPIEPEEKPTATTLSALPAIAAAPNVAVPGQEAGAEEETTSGKRKSARSGKKSLTVARNTGGGVNV